jgi:hypothetical protein
MPRTSTPSLDELAERLTANGVAADPSKVASAILGLARLREWNSQPGMLVSWLEQLALDVAHAGRWESPEP